MSDDDKFSALALAGLARVGMTADALELGVMRVAEQVYGPDLAALLDADLSEMPVEHGLDPARPPHRDAQR